MLKGPFVRQVIRLFLLPAFSILLGARTPLGTSVFAIPVELEECKDRVSRVLTAEGFEGWEPFGNGWQAYKGETSASIGCIAGRTTPGSVVMIVVSGVDNAVVRLRFTDLIRNPRSTPVTPPPSIKPPPQPPPATVGRAIDWKATGFEVRNGKVRAEGSNQPTYKDKERVLVSCSRWDDVTHPIWGTDTYHEDSSICWSGLHAGLLSREQGGSLYVEFGPDASPYRASNRNGVRTEDYTVGVRGSFRLSAATGSSLTVDVEKAKPVATTPPLTGGRRIDWWTKGNQLRDGSVPNEGSGQPKYQIGDRVLVNCAGQAFFPGGGLWGTDRYTLDSTVCAAGIHAGVSTLQRGGSFYVEFTPDAGSYSSTDHNGIRSGEFGRNFAAGSFRVHQ
jgi:hypothetical protein